MNKLMRELKYSLYLSVHPIKGFWELKHEKQGSLPAGFILVALCIIVSVCSAFFTGYLFNKSGGIYYQYLSTVSTILLLYFAWCVSNWCLTCLNDGEGRFVDILTATAYALTPYIVLQFILIFLGNFFVIREETFYYMINSVSFVWMGGLVFFGSLVTHQYSFSKNLVVCVATLLGMAIIAYIGLLFFNLLQQMIGFASVISDEIYLRMLWGTT